MECPYCRSKVYVYRRKTMTPEFRCRDCEATWDDPYIDGHVEPSFKRTLEGGCPECGARGYNNYPGFVEGRGELSGSLNDPYPEENYKGCIACGNEWAISDYVQEQEEFEAEMKRYAEMERERIVVPSAPSRPRLKR
jgi:predicted  nucleic acid-binding Zn-ribbon protein